MKAIQLLQQEYINQQNIIIESFKKEIFNIKMAINFPNKFRKLNSV